MTVILTLTPGSPDAGIIQAAASAIRHGGLVAFPTETVYGLGANALDAAAVQRIFTAKGRPAEDPLIVHLASASELTGIVRSVPPLAYRLAATFWPGPLTLILPKQARVPGIVTAGLDNVAVRVPNHPVALALLEAAGLPIAAPSANRFGHTSPTSAAHVLADLDGQVDIILDGGATTVGVESTVLDLTCTPPRLLRPGGVTREMLEALIGPVNVLRRVQKRQGGLPSPGLLDKHYAPRAEMVLFKGAAALAHMHVRLQAELAAGRLVGVLAVDEEAGAFEAGGARVYRLGPGQNLKVIAQNLYAGMRALDAGGVAVIFCRDFGTQGLGLALRDRLTRAATQVVSAEDQPGAA